MERLDDAEIVEAVIRGDTTISDQLYLRLVDTVDVTLYRIFGRREVDHEDWVQRSFEQIVLTLSRRSFAGACSLRTWAAAVTSRVAFNTLRARKNERRVIARELDPEGELDARSADAERQLAARAELEELRCALAELEPKRAEAVFLHDVLGHELSEIAVLSGVTVAAAQSRLVRGRRDLYERLAISSRRRGR